ncbi:MAG: P-II family nitrogen regulator, partial [Candidatus Omnitrophica bacterium]|nr:P-II family nitrogen regulator [Candidatus Omnitrophota bacterium]
MKLIIALIQPHKLPDVKKALFDADVYKMTVTNALGCGQQKGFTETYRGVIHEVNLLKKVRIEIAVNEDFVKPAIDAI